MKKLPTTEPKDVLKVELPPPELKKVELPPPKPVYVDIGFWETLWLLITSVLRNKAKDAMEGKPVSSLLIGGWWKVGVIVAVIGVVVWVVLRIF